MGVNGSDWRRDPMMALYSHFQLNRLLTASIRSSVASGTKSRQECSAASPGPEYASSTSAAASPRITSGASATASRCAHVSRTWIRVGR